MAVNVDAGASLMKIVKAQAARTRVQQFACHRCSMPFNFELQSLVPLHGRGEVQMIETPYSGFLMSEQGFRLTEYAGSLEDFERMLIRRDGHLLGRAETPNSMANEPYNTVAGYHFSKSPLRLTPQRRYCRGLVAAHLVLNDDTTYQDYPQSTLEEDLKV